MLSSNNRHRPWLIFRRYFSELLFECPCLFCFPGAWRGCPHPPLPVKQVKERAQAKTDLCPLRLKGVVHTCLVFLFCNVICLFFIAGKQNKAKHKNGIVVFLWLVLPYLNTSEPLSYSCETLLGSDIIHHNHTISLTKELLGDASIPAGQAAGSSKFMGTAYIMEKCFFCLFTHVQICECFVTA